VIVIIDYGVGNLGSVENMLKKIGVKAVVSSDAAEIDKAEKLILPGVGAFDHGMQSLNERGLSGVLNRKVVTEKTPILGLCLGMQLFAKTSEEGRSPGLGWLDAALVRFDFGGSDVRLKVPHMGWNFIRISRPHPVLDGFDSESRFYFVHSYYMKCGDPSDVLAFTDYPAPFAAAVGRGHIVGVQFHPEKSHKFGMHLLRNFAEWRP
jgi:imidazole glycerol-phosphate synthase subunit HisH